MKGVKQQCYDRWNARFATGRGNRLEVDLKVSFTGMCSERSPVP